MAFPSGGGGQDDIAFRAYVEDTTGEFFDRFDANVDRINNTTTSAFAGIDNSIKSSGAQWALLGGIAAGVASKVTQVLFDMSQQAIQFMKGSVDLRARVDTLSITLEQMGTRAGYSKDQLSQYEEELKSTGITTSAAIQSMVRMIRANIDLAEASKLARISQDAAVVAGINSSQAFERMVLGIQKREPEMLDELGITLNRTDAYERFAVTVGKTVKQLSTAEQQQAILNDIYRQSAVVAGVYESAMGSVGKQVTSLPRYFEELQLAVGGAFQSAYSAKIEFMTDTLKDLHEWVKENEDAIAQFDESFGKFATGTLRLLREIVDVTIKIPGYIKGAGVSIAEFIGYLAKGEEGVRIVGENSKHLGEYFTQAISIVVGGVTMLITQAKTGIELIANVGKAAIAGLRGDYVELARLKEEQDRLIDMGSRESLQQQWGEATRATAEFLGLLETEVPAAAAAAEQSFDSLGDTVDNLALTLQKAEQEVMDLANEFQMELAQEAVQETRRLQLEAIRQGHQLEDIHRNHQERISSIMESAGYSRNNAVEQYEQQRADIIRDSNRRIEQMQYDFNFSADELARRRDAVGLLRLARSHEKQVREERKNRDQSLKDAERAFEQQLKMIDIQTQRQIEAAEKVRQAQIAQFQLQMEREREIRELQDQWEKEDREEKYRQKLEELIGHYANEEGITAQHIQNLLNLWSSYYGAELDMMARYAAAKASTLAAYNPSTGTGVMSNYDLQHLIGGGIIGQAGIVSRMLPSRTAFQLPKEFGRGVSAVPAVSARGGGTTRKEIHVTVDGNGLDPIIQRQVVNTLYEIERNSG